ncbi:hypothetical protein F0562_026373 [Nyssa sinensis]|uniref:Uncharacterized protein n=1 Tax=Nyssa sinensis TaxID=561372 RepID=A0A5J5BEU2_9ASTE|nr:hypothetical protein F0562_026373 [Nyssa sinensis]
MNNHDRSIIHRRGIIRLHHLLLLFLLLLLLSAATPCTTAQSTAGPSQYDDSFSKPLAIVVVVFVCIIFFLAFFSIYIRGCSDNGSAENSRRFYAYATAVSRRVRSQGSPLGLDPSVIESFPIFVYSAVKDLKMVCRAYLEPCPGDKARRSQFMDSPEEQNQIPEFSSEVRDHVSINVQENRTRDSINEIVNTNQTPKLTRQRVVEKFPRSHSTGHSLVQPGENSERYTLRLPDEIMKQIVSRRLERTTSSVRGYWSGGEEISWLNHEWSDRVGRSDQWVFKMMPPFFSRNSGISSKVSCEGDLSVVDISVKTPPETPDDQVERSSTQLPV